MQENLNKAKNVQKAFEHFRWELSTKVESSLAKINKDLDAFTKKYNEMFSLLMRQFMVSLEKRVRFAEINSIAIIKLYVHKFYEMEKKINPEFNLSFEEYSKNLEEEMNGKVKQVMQEMEKVDNDSMVFEEEKKEETTSN